MNYCLSNKLRSSVNGAPWVLYGGIVTWLAMVCVGMFGLTAYANYSEPAPHVTKEWLETSSIERSRNQGQLIAFIHPRCSCSRATVRQLMQLTSQATGSFDVSFQFFCPSSQPRSWVKTPLWEMASTLPNAQCEIDWDGTEAQLHGVNTSGHVLFFDEQGTCQFNGGVTISRGHDGESVALKTLSLIVNQRHTSFVEYPVFGCALFTSVDTLRGGKSQ